MDETDQWTLLGVDAADVATYREVLLHPVRDAAERAAALGLTPDDLRHSLERLAALRLVRMTGAGWEPVNPRAALVGLARRRQSELDRVSLLAEELGASYEAGRLRAAPDRLLEVVRGRSDIVGRIVELFAQAQTELAWTDVPPYIAGFDADLERAELDALERGLRVRVLYDASVLDDEFHVRTANESAVLGEVSRLRVGVASKIVLVDGHTAILPLARSQTHGESHAAIVHRSAITEALAVLFETLWDQASPAPWTPRSDGARPSRTLGAEERRILELMAAGVSDAAIARHLGLTERTLRRRIEAVRQLTGADSRFQLALEAQRRGWV